MRGHPQVQKYLDRMSGTLWVRPFVLVAVGVLLGTALPIIEVKHLEWHGIREAAWLAVFLKASPGATRDVMLAGVGALATILAVGFTMTLVTVQLAASQYSSRLLRKFLADKTTQWVLGIFLGTISYLLLVLRALQGLEGGQTAGFTPVGAVMLGTVLVTVCLLLIAFFLHHMARSVNAATLVSSVGKQTLKTLERLHLRAPGQAQSQELRALEEDPSLSARSRRVPARTTGYVLQIDEAGLCDALPEGVRTVRVDVRPGDFLLPGQSLVTLWPPVPVSDAQARAVGRSVATSTERSLRHDVMFGVRQLVDVALKALSPSINDPTTAQMVVNELALVTRAVALGCGAGGGWRVERRGEVRIIVRSFGLDGYLPSAYGELPRAAKEHPRILARVLESLGQVADQVDDPGARAALERAGARVLDAIDTLSLDGTEQAMVDGRWVALRAAARGEPAPQAPDIH
jgi:uncharacterized membrane protein